MNEQVSQQTLMDAVEADQSRQRRRRMPMTILGQELTSANRFKDFGRAEALVEDLLLFGEVSMLAAPPNTGKTSVVAAIAAHASSGGNLGEREVARTATLYIAAEDQRGVLVRAAVALRMHGGRKMSIDVFGDDIDLTNRRTIEKLGDDIREYMRANRIKRLFVVIDTLNLCIGDGDENSSSDMRKALKNARKIATDHNAHVMIIHHTSHADPTRARGSSAIGGTADTVLVLEEASNAEGDKLVKIFANKQRNLDKGRSTVFWRLSVADLGQCRKGKNIRAPFAETFDKNADTVIIAPKRPSKAKPSSMDDRKAHLLDVLRKMDADQPSAFHSMQTVEGQLSKPFEAAMSKPGSLRKALQRTCKQLEDSNLVEISEGSAMRVKT